MSWATHPAGLRGDAPPPPDPLAPYLGRVAAFARQEKLFRAPGPVIVAVSGGQDSVACLVLLHRLQAELGVQLMAVHFDHQLRPDSRDDLEYVRGIAATLGVPFLSGEGDVRDAARRQKRGIEETARQMRYQFLAFVAGEKRASAVVTGHTADDQAETVFMRILRGTGVRGLRGMLPVATIPGAPQALVRPLLCLSRAETAHICQLAGTETRIDPTNASLDPLRNRIRRETLPSLRVLNPSVDDALRRLASAAREAFADVERLSYTVQPRERTPAGAVFLRQPLAALPTEALTLVIEREAAFARLQPEVNATRLANLRQVLRGGSGEVRFGDTTVEVSCGLVRAGPALTTAAYDARILNVPGATGVGSWRVEVATGPFASGPAGVAVNAETAQGALRARPLAPGDHIRTPTGLRKASNLLVARKVPRWERDGALALADGQAVLALLEPPLVILPPGPEPLHVRAVPLPAR